MNTTQHTLKHKSRDALTLVNRTSKSGEPRAYSYKMFRVRNRNGRITTVSMEHFDYIEMRTSFKATQGEVSDAMRTAALHLASTNSINTAVPFSKQVVALANKALEALRSGVDLADYLHAEANNSRWT